MSLELAFHGAAGTVTGSCIEIKAGKRRLLIDCGLFQGSRQLEALNHQQLPFDPRSIDAVVLTHAHLDHSGRLPLLARAGSEARIWCTPATEALLEPLLLDAAKLQAADARRRNRRPDRAGMPRFEAIYDANHVRQLTRMTRSLGYGEWAEPLPGIRIRLSDAHHILGAASVELEADGQRLLFSGDIGPDAAADLGGGPGFDHVICESTYGDRDRATLTPAERLELLAGIVEAALARGGNLLIPAFALERTQAILADLIALFDNGRLSPSPIFVDSPLAERVTHAYRRFRAERDDARPLDHPQVRFTPNQSQSRALDRVTGAIILAGSGMCNGGRIRQHLLTNLPRPESTVLIAGYQARGTLGSALLTHPRTVRISGSDVRVHATILSTDIYSAHADHSALLSWIAGRAPVRGTLFLDHGEEAALARLAEDAGRIAGVGTPVAPGLGERFRLDAGVPARRIGKPRIGAHELVTAEDWHSRYAAIAATMEERLAAMPTDVARRRAIDAVARALEQRN